MLFLASLGILLVGRGEGDESRSMGASIDTDVAALERVAGTTISALDLPRLLHSVLQALVEITGADAALILLREDDRVQVRAGYGKLGAAEEGFSVRVGEGFAGRLIEVKKPMFIRDVQGEGVDMANLRRMGVRSVLGVPLLDGENAIGTVELAWRSVHEESERELRLLTVAAERVATAIVAVRLHEEVVESNNLANALNDINALIGSAQDFWRVADEVLRCGSKALGTDGAILGVIDGKVMTVVAAIGRLGHIKGMRVSLDAGGMSRLRSGEVQVDSIMATEHMIDSKVIERLGTKSMMIVPLITPKRMEGAIIFSHLDEIRIFTPGQIDFGRKLGASLSLALHNAELASAEHHQRGLLEKIVVNSPAFIALFSYNGKDFVLEMANQAYADALGITAPISDLIGRRFQDFAPGAIRSGIIKMFRDSLLTDRPYFNDEWESPAIVRGPTFWKLAVIPIVQGRKGELLVTGVEVTNLLESRKRAEDLVRVVEEERTRLRTILDTLPVGVIITDASGRIIEKNGMADRVWGGSLPPTVTLDDFAQYQGWWASSGKRLESKDWGLVRALTRGKISIGEVIDIQRFDGSRGTMIISSAPVRDINGKIIGAVAIMQDITSQRKLERRAVEEKERSEFYLDLLTHDLNNLNAAAIGYLQLLTGSKNLSEKERAWIWKALESTGSASELINNVRKIHKIEESALERRTIDVCALLSEVKMEHEHVPGREVHIELETDHHCNVQGTHFLRDVFNNLVGNSIKHSTGALTIWLTNRIVDVSGKKMIRVEVADNGPGIPDEAKGRIFHRAQRGPTKATGTGLGLFLARTLVEGMNGRIWVEDRVPGDPSQGARFVVELPAANEVGRERVTVTGT